MENDKLEQEFNEAGTTEIISDTTSYLGWFIMLSHKYDSHEKGLYPDISKEDWIEIINKRMKEIADLYYVDNLMYVFHEPEDSENSMDGEKGFHCHAVVRFNGGDKKTGSSSKDKAFVVDLFKASDRSKNVTNIDSYLACYRYMTHISDQAIEDEKTPYPFTDVHVLGTFYYQKEITEIVKKKPVVVGVMDMAVTGQQAYKVAIKKTTWTENTKLVSKELAKKMELSLAEKVLDGDIRHVQAFNKFKTEAGYGYARDVDFEQDALNRVDVVYDEMIATKTRDLRNIYIAGDGGVGKTFLANELAEHYAKDLGVYIGSPSGKKKTPDPMNHLKDEKVVVLNEVGSDMFSVDEFNNSFDPNMMSPFSSRNENKKFIGDTIIMTQSVLHSRFSKDLLLFDAGGSKFSDPTDKRELNQLKSTQDKYYQIRRRIKNNIILMRDKDIPELIWGYVFNLNSQLKDHIYVGKFCFENPFAENKAPSISEKELENAVKLLDVSTVDFAEEDIETIGDFADRNNLDEILKDDLFTRFMAEMEKQFQWDLLPNTFLLALFNAWLEKYEPSENLWGLSVLSARLKEYANTVSNWEYKENAVSSNNRMDNSEPLIEEYWLKDWLNPNGRGTERCKPILKNRYRGLVRIKKDLLD